MTTDEKFMKKALLEAEKAVLEDEVPVGAVAVLDGKIIARAHNNRERTQNAINHAEMLVIQKACKKLASWRLDGVTLYVTIEPCPMCTGAIINSRLRRVVFGASDYKAGSCGSVVNLFELPYNHKPELVSGFMADECSALLTDVFANLRKIKNERKPL